MTVTPYVGPPGPGAPVEPPGPDREQRPRPRPSRTARIVALTLGGLLTVAMIGYGCFALIALLDRQSETVQRQFAAASLRAVEVHTSGVGITVVGDDTAGAPSTVRSKTTWSWNHPSFTTALGADGTLRVRVHCFDPGPIGCTGRVTLHVPSRVPVTASSGDGSVEVSHMTGGAALTSSDGAVRLSDVAGDLALRTSDGSVHADGLRSARVVAHTGDGGVYLAFAQVPGAVRATTGDGSVHVRLPDQSGPFSVDVSTGDGSKHVDVRTDPRASRTVTVHTGDGGVRVDYLR